jgi:MFS family permease
MMASMFLGPVLVVQGLGRTSTAGGMLMVVVQASVVATSFLGGWLHDRTRARWIRPAAVGILILGFLGWAASGVAGSYAAMIAIGFFTGCGSGVLLAVNNVVIMRSLPGEFRGVASGMLETTRQFGHAFGVTIPTAILALVLAGAVGADGTAASAALRWGFFWSCLGMGAAAALALPLALVRSRAAERERGIMVTTS